ncbi:hypothetical protein NPIL_203561 [Nephila pilipes]|uniref:Uncharacterized protein n=1 Tax=Nephila pilipes TaxID=299642 RepID=A0A8X6QCR5_NEPPI|nr:hypothetical protein NPIL_203561 [Nephila pilipes]
MPETILPTLLQNGFRLGDFRKLRQYHQNECKLPLPTPAQPPAEERPALGKKPFIGIKEPLQSAQPIQKKCGSPRSRDGSRDLRHLSLPWQCLSLNRSIPLL